MEAPLATNQWSDLAVSFNGVEVQFFVNGALVKDVTLIAFDHRAGQRAARRCRCHSRRSSSRARSTRSGSTTAR